MIAMTTKTAPRHRSEATPLFIPEGHNLPTGKHRAVPAPPVGLDTGTINALIEHGHFDGEDLAPLSRSRKITAGAIAGIGSTALLGVSIYASPSTATQTPADVKTATASIEVQPVVTADAAASLREAVPTVKTEAAPPPPKVEEKAPAPAPAPKPAAPAPKPAPAPAAPAPAAPAAPAPAPAPAPSTKAAAIARAALAQVGIYQDCVAMVARALKNGAGIDWYKWPVEYYQIGYAVSAAEAIPGDLIYYVDGGNGSVSGWAHIAVYIGNGQAVHGGFNGNQTVVFSVNVGSGPNYIRVR